MPKSEPDPFPVGLISQICLVVFHRYSYPLHGWTKWVLDEVGIAELAIGLRKYGRSGSRSTNFSYRFCLQAFWWFFATLSVICLSYLPTGSFAPIIIWEIIQNSTGQPEICWWALFSLCCFCRLEFASKQHSQRCGFQTPTQDPHFSSVKLFPTHSRSYFLILFLKVSCQALWVLFIFLRHLRTQ